MNKFFAASMAVAIALTAGSAFAEGDGDAKKGAKIFKKCKACHTALDSGKNGMGPNLNGVIGRTAGTLASFVKSDGTSKYSDAVKNSGITWDKDNLETWLDKEAGGPKAMIPGTKMGFKGLKKEKDVKNLLAYIEAKSD